MKTHPYVVKQAEEISELQKKLTLERERGEKLELSLKEQNTTSRLGQMHFVRNTPGKLIDAHFHWDRLNKVTGVKVEKLLSREVKPTPHSDLEVEGGIMVFCDPQDFPNGYEIGNIKTKGKFGVAMGIHPNYSKGNISRLKPAVELIREQMERRNLNGLGEVGLDFLKGGNIKKQEQILEWILPLARPEIPLILHIRGIPEDSNSELAYSHALHFL